jgi:RNA polymerase primary sigma factor
MDRSAGDRTIRAERSGDPAASVTETYQDARRDRGRSRERNGPARKIRAQVDRVTGELSAELRREPTEGELVERLDWTAEQVRDVKGTKPDAASLSKLVSSQDGTSRLKDFILGETSCDVPDAVIEEKAAAWLREAIGRLLQKARYVLVRRYGLDDRDPATLAELAAELNLSRERVRQHQREAEFLLKSGARRVPRPSVA